MIVGMAVPTTDRSRAATEMAAMIPTVTNAWLRVIGGIGGWAARADDVMAIEGRSHPRWGPCGAPAAPVPGGGAAPGGRGGGGGAGGGARGGGGAVRACGTRRRY